jgi:glyoxylase-like metal-dependent hydrolase (beta-lactamase superfamily II)
MLKVMIAPVTPFQQNCSIVWCDETMEGTAVDPGGDFDMLKEAIAQQGIKVTKVLLTHGHVDHASAAGTMAEHYGVKIEGPAPGRSVPDRGPARLRRQVQLPGLQAVRARPLAQPTARR